MSDTPPPNRRPAGVAPAAAPALPSSFASFGSPLDNLLFFHRALGAVRAQLPQPALSTPMHMHMNARDDSSSAPAPSSLPSSSSSASSSTPSSSAPTPPAPTRSHPTTSPHAAALENEAEEPLTEQQVKASVDAMFRAYKVNPPAARYVAEPQPVPERCYSWCSQRDGRSSTCRMLCFRRRAPLSTREETLARLRPQTHTKETGMFAPSTPTPEPAAPARDLGFFENLRQFLTPYSFILMKGSPEGVIGRYMEELEGDDGEYDFGPLSRHAPDALRRKSTGNLEWFDWGESGYMVHVPLTSVFAPVLDLPTNADRVLGPPYRLISQYLNTFSDGTQERGIHRLVDEVKRGGAFEMIGRIGDHYSKKVAEGRERAAAARAQQASAVEEAARAQEAVSAAQKPTNVPNAPVKDKEGKGE